MLAYSPQNIFATLDCYTPKKSSDTHGHRSITVKPDVLLMGTLQTSATTLVFRLTARVEQVATCMSKLLSSFGTSWQELVEIFQNVSSVTSIFWRQVCKFLRGWATEQLPRSSQSREKSCTISSRRWWPANRNIISHHIIIKHLSISKGTRVKRVHFILQIHHRQGQKLFVPSNQAFQENTSHDEGICSQYWKPFEAIIQLLLRFVPVLNQTSTESNYFLPFLKRRGTIIMYVSYHKPQ